MHETRNNGGIMTTSTFESSRGAGHYGPDRSAWYDERRKRWYHLLPAKESVQIELEDVGDTGWWKRVLTTLFAQNGQQQLRFVAREQPGSAAEGSATPRPVAVGSTFASPRWVADAPPEPEWAPGMTAGLAELREDLEGAGWLPEGRGSEPWSYRYVRPEVDWSREYTGPAEGSGSAGGR
jgi:hypothetical protein